MHRARGLLLFYPSFVLERYVLSGWTQGAHLLFVCVIANRLFLRQINWKYVLIRQGLLSFKVLWVFSALTIEWPYDHHYYHRYEDDHSGPWSVFLSPKATLSLKFHPNVPPFPPNFIFPPGHLPICSLMYEASGKGATNGHRIDDDGTRWSRAHTEVNRVVDNFYYGFGLRVAQNPLKTLTICFCFVILCCLGFVNFAVVTRGESRNETNLKILYVPSVTLRAFCVCSRRCTV